MVNANIALIVTEILQDPNSIEKLEAGLLPREVIPLIILRIDATHSDKNIFLKIAYRGALKLYNGNIARLARDSGMSRQRLRDRIKQLGLEAQVKE